jgi:hypothetical protein
MSKQAEVTGIGKFCDSQCPICVAARGKAGWLKPVLKAEYYTLARFMRMLHVTLPCTSREKQTGKKPWE